MSDKSIIKNLEQSISEFSVTKLHGEKNVKMLFHDAIKIIVSENGCGKTTILNLLYSTLYGKYEKIRSTQFETISLTFYSGDKITLSKSDFSLDFTQIHHSGMLQHFLSFLSQDKLADLLDDYKNVDREHLKTSHHFLFAYKEFQRKKIGNVTDDVFVQWLDMLSNELKNVGIDPINSKLKELREIVRDNFPFDFIYLPTYRRIEEELRNFTDLQVGFDVEKNVIQFGMADVQASFNQITAEIKNSSIRWFSIVNGKMLHQLISGIQVTSEMKEKLKDKDALRIVLDRIGNNMTTEDKEEILRLISTDKIHDNQPLAYFLANLFEVYEEQKNNDNAIKLFMEKCNKYLVDKKVFYDESAVEISIKRKKNNHTVLIDTLSSGEKQIISIFSRLFLSKSDKVAIFFDEPELSLSLEWQVKLLPDIIASGQCGFLFCTTHSPFIFEDDLEKYTCDLDQYIEEI